MDDGEFLAELDKLVAPVHKPVADDPVFADHELDFDPTPGFAAREPDLDADYDSVSPRSPAGADSFDVVTKRKERIPGQATRFPADPEPEPRTREPIHVSRTVAALTMGLCVGFGACTAALVFHEQVMQLAAKWTQSGR
jgi:hypothetical protein